MVGKGGHSTGVKVGTGPGLVGVGPGGPVPPTFQSLGVVTGRNHNCVVYTTEIILIVTCRGGGLKLEVKANEKPEDSLAATGMLKKETTDPVLGLGVTTVVMIVASAPLPRARVVVTPGKEKTVSPGYVLGGKTYKIRKGQQMFVKKYPGGEVKN